MRVANRIETWRDRKAGGDTTRRGQQKQRIENKPFKAEQSKAKHKIKKIKNAQQQSWGEKCTKRSTHVVYGVVECAQHRGNARAHTRTRTHLHTSSQNMT